MRLIEKFSGTDCSATTTDPNRVAVTLAGRTFELTRAEAVELRDSLGTALTRTHEFVHTTGEHRSDGTYQVARRGATSSGHSKVFESFDQLRGLYDRLPAEFTAETVGRSGLTGGRRHMLVRHLAEHPAFECSLVSRQPLTVRKRHPDERGDDE